MVLWEALDALSHQLELCAVEAGSRVAVVLDDDISNDRVALIRAAVARCGAEALIVHPIRSGPLDTETTMLDDVVATADIVISTRPTHDFELRPDQQLLYLADCEPHAHPPHANLRRRVRELAQHLRQGAALHITDHHGTDLHVDVAASAVSCDHGIIEDDHRSASFPAGWAAVIPPSGTVHGDLIIMPGDACLNASRIISSPLRLHIVDDYISAIEGDSPDADVIRALLEYADQPSAYGCAEISVGMNPGRARATPFDDRLLDLHVARLLAGVVTIAFGDNLLADRPCDQTVTLALPSRSVHLDDLPVLVDGRLQGDFAPDVYEL